MGSSVWGSGGHPVCEGLSVVCAVDVNWPYQGP